MSQIARYRDILKGLDIIKQSTWKLLKKLNDQKTLFRIHWTKLL